MSGAPIAIRRCQRQDIAAVHAMLNTAWHETYDDILGPDRVAEISARWHSPACLAADLEAAGSCFLIARQGFGGDVVASAYAVCESDQIDLRRLYVLRRWHGHGVGSALLAQVIAGFARASAIRLEVEPRNRLAIAFYRARGFSVCGRIAACGGETALAALVMGKSLGLAATAAASPSKSS